MPRNHSSPRASSPATNSRRRSRRLWRAGLRARHRTRCGACQRPLRWRGLQLLRSKEELFVVACACEMEEQKAQLRLRMAELGPLPDRLRAAVDFAVASAMEDGYERSFRAHS